MEIVIATPYKIANFGAILQAWALRTVLERMGHRVRYLNCRYIWPGVFGWKRLLCSRSVAAFFAKLRINRLMRNVMAEMGGGFPETRPYDSVAALLAHPPKADCFIAGSDQIFGSANFLSRKRYLPVLLGFGDSETKRIAYAGSFGTHTTEKLVKSEEVSKLMHRFAAIGVRERSGVDILREWMGIEGEWTPDPTLLLMAEDYRKAFSVNANTPGGGGYIATYMLGWQDKARFEKACAEARKELGKDDMKIVNLSEALSLGEWLTKLSNASCVITNSFHGYCFSQIFGVPHKILEFEGADYWRSERTRDLRRALKEYSLADMSRIGHAFLMRNIGVAQ